MRNTIFSGFLFDKNWEMSMRKLKPKQFYQLFWEFYDYQMSKGRIKIPPFHDNEHMDVVASFIQPQILNRLCGARVFSASEETDNTPEEDIEGIVPPTAGGDVGGSTGGDAPPTAPKLRQVKSSQVELSQGKQSRAELSHHEENIEVTPSPACPPACPPQESEFENNSENQNESQKQGYGTSGEGMLTPEEYQHLIMDLGIPLIYIDHFAKKNAAYRYRIQDHAATIEAWWAQDKHKPQWTTFPLRDTSADYAAGEPYGGRTFDAKQMLADAVRASMGDALADDWDVR